MSLELRAVTHFFWLKHTPKQAILFELEEVCGNDVITLRAAEKWTAAFDGGLTAPPDLPRFGRPRDTGKVDAVRALIEGEGCLSHENIAQILGVHRETVKRILRHDLNMRKVNFKWVPHALDNCEKAVRVRVLQEPLDFFEGRTDQNVPNVYTGGETWA
jgi:hypothetical protein